MATIGCNQFIEILIAIILVIGIGGWLLGSDFFGLPDGDNCLDPDGCQCGIMTKCASGQSCERRGPFGSCRAL